MEFELNDIQIFGSTSCYANGDGYKFFNIVKFYFNEEVNIGFSCYFCILQKWKGVLQ